MKTKQLCNQIGFTGSVPTLPACPLVALPDFLPCLCVDRWVRGRLPIAFDRMAGDSSALSINQAVNTDLSILGGVTALFQSGAVVLLAIVRRIQTRFIMPRNGEIRPNARKRWGKAMFIKLINYMIYHVDKLSLPTKGVVNSKKSRVYRGKK